MAAFEDRPSDVGGEIGQPQHPREVGNPCPSDPICDKRGLDGAKWTIEERRRDVGQPTRSSLNQQCWST
jgi:hypothetical protein